ncbi:MAG: hypothetical protein M1587_00120 [Thaumarchaeota archaeon]|nr:hypothetical protein [Nitrososphaerota archaeon]
MKLEYSHEATLSLSRLENNQADVTVLGRILSIGPLKIFERKSDSKRGLLNRIVVFDETTTIAVNLWDSKASEVLESNELSPGDLVRISHAYVRPAIDGTPTLNAGDKTKVEKLLGEQQAILGLDSRILDADSIPEDGRTMIVGGRVSGELRRGDFVRKDGTRSQLCSFSLAGEKSETRVVIWNSSNPVFSTLKNGEKITLLNVRSRTSSYQGRSILELHGDDATCILEKWAESKEWMKDLLKKSKGDVNARTSKASNVLPLIARIISLRKSEEERRAYLLLVDSQKRLIPVLATGEVPNELVELGVDDIILCKPDSIDPVSMKVTCSSKGAISKLGSKRQDIPVASSYVRTIESLEENTTASLQVMSLSECSTREIQTKDGLVKRSEILAADPTGEIRIYAWRNLAKLLEGISAGETLTLSAAEVQSHEGKKFIVLKNHSRVELSTA